jgi:hypothetical protein
MVHTLASRARTQSPGSCRARAQARAKQKKKTRADLEQGIPAQDQLVYTPIYDVYLYYFCYF